MTVYLSPRRQCRFLSLSLSPPLSLSPVQMHLPPLPSCILLYCTVPVPSPHQSPVTSPSTPAPTLPSSNPGPSRSSRSSRSRDGWSAGISDSHEPGRLSGCHRTFGIRCGGLGKHETSSSDRHQPRVGLIDVQGEGREDYCMYVLCTVLYGGTVRYYGTTVRLYHRIDSCRSDRGSFVHPRLGVQ
jgi:hypothetical protein